MYAEEAPFGAFGSFTFFFGLASNLFLFIPIFDKWNGLLSTFIFSLWEIVFFGFWILSGVMLAGCFEIAIFERLLLFSHLE
jgi:hypothetical protein